MTYIEIWRQRIAGGTATIQEAFEWLCGHGMNPIFAWERLHG
jgi:hypothetical protein